MEELTLSLDVIEKEINYCEELVGEFKKKHNELTEKDNYLNEQLKVWRVIEEKITNNGGTKALVDVNIESFVSQRFELATEINVQQANIDQYSEIIGNLKEIRSEIE